MGMTKEEFQTIAKSIRCVYGDETIRDKFAFEIWYSLLKDLDYRTVTMAVQSHMSANHFKPTPADIRAMVVKAERANAPDALEAWAMVKKALRNSLYHADEEFMKLPADVQEAVGSPSNLKDWAGMDTETVNSVEQSHFVKAYNNVVQRSTANSALPPSLQVVTTERRFIPISSKETAEERTETHSGYVPDYLQAHMEKIRRMRVER